MNCKTPLEHTNVFSVEKITRESANLNFSSTPYSPPITGWSEKEGWKELSRPGLQKNLGESPKLTGPPIQEQDKLMFAGYPLSLHESSQIMEQQQDEINKLKDDLNRLKVLGPAGLPKAQEVTTSQRPNIQNQHTHSYRDSNLYKRNQSGFQDARMDPRFAQNVNRSRRGSLPFMSEHQRSPNYRPPFTHSSRDVQYLGTHNTTRTAPTGTAQPPKAAAPPPGPPPVVTAPLTLSQVTGPPPRTPTPPRAATPPRRPPTREATPPREAPPPTTTETSLPTRSTSPPRQNEERFRYGPGSRNHYIGPPNERINYQSMPRIEIAPFSGDRHKYVLFKNKFNASIGHWSSMPSAEKAVRLLGLLRDRPFELVEGYCRGNISDYTYQEMWKSLESRYGGETRLRNNPLEKLKAFSQLKDMKHTSLERLLDLFLELKTHYHVQDEVQLTSESSMLQHFA